MHLRLPRRHSPPLRRLPSPEKHLLQIFCPFGVRYLYLFICDSTITCTWPVVGSSQFVRTVFVRMMEAGDIFRCSISCEIGQDQVNILE